ncbi:hypothetical protein WMF27_10510 [Sorangium sp. So ce281]|uniref:hypothetical protein n=1 Tax=Sorangium sp. So ce281 TaxID=3133293 RepID=UPI003F60AE93
MLRKSAAAGRGYRAVPKRRLGKQTIKNTLNLLRCCLEAAVEHELIRENPAQERHATGGSNRYHGHHGQIDLPTVCPRPLGQFS